MTSLYVESTFQLPADGHLGCFHVIDIVKMVVNMAEHASLCQKIKSFGFMPRTGIAQSYNSPVSIEEAPRWFPQCLRQFSLLFRTSLGNLIAWYLHVNNTIEDSSTRTHSGLWDIASLLNLNFNICEVCWAWWPGTVIPATWEAEAWQLQIWGQPGQLGETLSQNKKGN